MNTQELANSVQISADELIEVLKVLGVNATPEQQLPEAIDGVAIGMYMRSLKSAANKEKLSLVQMVAKARREVSRVSQKVSGTNDKTQGGTGFDGIDPLEYLKAEFLSITGGNCTAEQAESNPNNYWGLVWLSLKGICLPAASQMAAVQLNATFKLARQMFLQGTAGELSPDITKLHGNILSATEESVNFLNLPGLLGQSPEPPQLMPATTETK